MVRKVGKHQRSKQTDWDLCWNIVNKRNFLWSRANIEGASKNAKIYVGRSTILHNLLFSAHTLCMNYETKTFLLVRTSVRSEQLLCFVQVQGQKSEQKHTTKNFDEFHNHSPLLTMVGRSLTLYIFCFKGHWLCMLLMAMLLLVSCTSTRDNLLYFCQVLCRVNPQNSEQKQTTKKFAKFPSHFPQLTVVS